MNGLWGGLFWRRHRFTGTSTRLAPRLCSLIWRCRSCPIFRLRPCGPPPLSQCHGFFRRPLRQGAGQRDPGAFRRAARGRALALGAADHRQRWRRSSCCSAHPAIRPRSATTTSSLVLKWALAFAFVSCFAYPIFTQDFWLSVVWGDMVASGINPYYEKFTPEMLGGLPLDHFPMTMSYGPLWALISAAIVATTGSSILPDRRRCSRSRSPRPGAPRSGWSTASCALPPRQPGAVAGRRRLDSPGRVADCRRGA